ncbi:hypothetical protein E2P81_ATG05387 [Venturia nashicola]|uniref:Uncharacterized protein n=1 Tax=Venturia nashicola TaxID=86259 RepID=A0A4Z1P349_9PEZI|nr:hypothetical protein E6O75_ATG05523 [Venturia nashicola]TLD32411.1 hypothetical protein E2P81_ATG05387 [Venturia nashicola]
MALKILISLRTAQVLIASFIFGFAIIRIVHVKPRHRLETAEAVGTAAGAWGIIASFVGFLDIVCFHNDETIGCILLTLLLDGPALGLFFCSGIFMLHAKPLKDSCHALHKEFEGLGQMLCWMDRAAAAFCLVDCLVTFLLLRIILLRHKAY